MKGYRFYADYGSASLKQKANPASNAIAILVDDDGRPLWNATACMEAITALFEDADSLVCPSAVTQDYLRQSCKRISESEARWIHPNLFAYLECDLPSFQSRSAQEAP